MSQALANLIRQRLDALAQDYQDQLLAIGGGYERAAPARLSAIARQDLELVAQSLETGDPAPWLDWIQDYLTQHPDAGLELETFLQAVSVIEDVLLPQADSLEDARSLWRVTRQARVAITGLASQRWRASESRLRQWIDRSPVGIFRATPEGRIVDANLAFLNILGYAALEDVVQVGLPSLYKDPTYHQRLLELLQQGVVSDFETCLRRADGQEVFISISARIIDSGEGQFLEGIIQSINPRQQAEQRLQQLARAVEATHDVVVITDRTGSIQFVNPAFEQVTGYSRAEALGNNPRVLKSGRHSHEFYADMWGTITSGQVWQGDVTNRRKDGALYEAQLTISPMRDETGAIRQFVAVQRDVTAQRRLQEQLVESERKYHHIVDRSLVGIYRTTPDGRVLEANPALLNMLGFESLEHFNRVGMDNIYVDPDERQRMLYQLRQGPVTDLEVRLQHTSGRIVHATFSANLVHDEQGQPQYLEGTVADISERKRAEQELQEQRTFTRLRLIIDTIPHLIFVKDRQGRFTLVNQALAQFHGCSVEDLLGKSDWDINPNFEQAQQLHLDDLEVIDGQREKFIPEEMTTDAAGQPVWLQTIKRPLVDADGVCEHLIGISTDISARKLLELEREETHERRARQVQLSTAIAHEVAAAPSLNELFLRAVTLIKERMDYYHVQIFRYEPALNAALLASGYGKIGEKMLNDGYRVDLEQSAVGTVAATGQPVLVSDVSQAPTWWEPNPYLPDTQGELALPIILRREHAGEQRDEMLGVLDVHSDVAGALTTEIQLALEGLCGRVAIAIESLRVRQEMEGRLQELDALYRATTREGWQTVAPTASSYRFDPMTSTLEDIEPTPAPAPQEGIISVPLLLRGETIGSVDIYDDPQAALSSDDVALIQSAAEQATQALERARLFEQTQITLTQTAALYNAGRRLNAAEDLQEVLAAVVEGVPVPAINRATLFLYEHDPAGEIETALVAANWHSGQGIPPTPIGQRYPWKAIAATMDVILESEPLFFEDIEHDERISPTMLEITKQQNIRALAMLPLQIGARRLGVLLLTAEEAHRFTEREIQPYLSLTGQMAVAIDNKNLFQQTQEALDEREVLYRASSELNTAQSYDDILTTLREHTVLGPGSVNINLQFFDRPWTDDQKPEWLDVAARWSKLPQEVLSPRYPVSLYASALQFLSPDTAILIEDIDQEPRMDDNLRALLQQHMVGVRGVAFVPLVVTGQWIGLVISLYDAPAHFSEEDRRRVMTLAGQAAVAAQSLRQLEQTQARAESEQRLRQVMAVINASQDVITDLPMIAQQLRELAPIDVLSLATYTPGNPDYVLFAVETGAESAAPQGIRHLLQGTAPGWVITNREPRLEADIRQDKPFSDDQDLIAQGIVSRLLLPMQVAGEITGSLNLSSAQPGAFTQEHLRILAPVADQIALALERASLLTKTQAALDEVGATHRRYLGEEWESTLAAIPDRTWSYLDSPEGMVATAEIWTPEIEQAVATGELTTVIETASDPSRPLERSALAIPIRLRGQTIGVLDFYHEGEARVWTDDDKALVTALATQVALALESQRLFEQTQRRGSRERLTAEVVGKIRAAGDIPTILETATQELGRALGVSRALIRLGNPNDKSQPTDESSNDGTQPAP